MSTFNRIKNSSKIYLLHYDHGERWKVSTDIKVEEKDWDAVKNKPKNSKLVYKGKNVADSLAQCQVWLAQALQDLRDNGGDLIAILPGFLILGKLVNELSEAPEGLNFWGTLKSKL